MGTPGPTPEISTPAARGQDEDRQRNGAARGFPRAAPLPPGKRGTGYSSGRSAGWRAVASRTIRPATASAPGAKVGAGPTPLLSASHHCDDEERVSQV